MNDKYYIRAAVQLAENFWGTSVQAYGPSSFHRPYASFEVDSPDTRLFLAGLADQLLDQIDAHDSAWTDISSSGLVRIFAGDGDKEVATQFGSDRRMNIIRAVVDSKVLEKA